MVSRGLKPTPDLDHMRRAYSCLISHMSTFLSRWWYLPGSPSLILGHIVLLLHFFRCSYPADGLPGTKTHPLPEPHHNPRQAHHCHLSGVERGRPRPQEEGHTAVYGACAERGARRPGSRMEQPQQAKLHCCMHPGRGLTCMVWWGVSPPCLW